MQRLVGDPRKRLTAMVTIQDILDALNQRPVNRWVDLIAEGIADLARELGNRKIPAPDAIDGLAEWARDVRSALRGLLLLTAHRSKGLEFDHVVILNCGWKALSKGEDGEAPRRLFYVAMIRARRSLAVVTSGAHAFVRADRESEVLRQVETPPRQDLPDPDQYQVPDLTSVDLSYAGRLAETSPTQDAISAAKVDDPVTLDRRDGKWTILDSKRRSLGRMSGNWAPPEGTDLLSGKIGAIVRWRKSDNEESYRSYLKRDEWETVLPELVFRKRGEGEAKPGLSLSIVQSLAGLLEVASLHRLTFVVAEVAKNRKPLLCETHSICLRFWQNQADLSGARPTPTSDRSRVLRRLLATE